MKDGKSHLSMLLVTVFLCAFAGLAIANFPVIKTVPTVFAIIIFIATFIDINYALYVLLFSMLLSPEIVVGHLPGRDIVIRVDDLLIVVIFIAWLARIAIRSDSEFFVKTPLNIFIMLFILSLIFSTGKGIMVGYVKPAKGIFYFLKFLEYLVIYFLAASNIRDKKQIKRLITVLLLVCAIVVIYGIVQIGGGHRVSAPFEGDVGEPNTLGGYLVFILSIIVGMFLHSSSKKKSFILGSLGLALIFPFLFTLSRASYMAIITMYLSFIIFSNSRGKLILTLIIISILTFFFIPQKVVDRIKYSFEAEKASMVLIDKKWYRRTDLQKGLSRQGIPQDIKIGGKKYHPDQIKQFLEKEDEKVIIGNDSYNRSWIEVLIQRKAKDIKIQDKTYSYTDFQRILSKHDSGKNDETVSSLGPGIKFDRKHVTMAGVTFGPSTSARIVSWIYALRKIREEPLLGVGLTGFRFIDSQYIRFLIELGLIGFTIFISLLFAMFYFSYKIYRNSKNNLFKGLSLGYICGLLAVLTHALTANTFLLIRIMEPFWFVTAIVMILPQLEEPKNDDEIIETNHNHNYYNMYGN